MVDLQLATTLTNPTGTGLLYVAYYQGGDLAIWKNGSSGARSIVSFKRVQPKPTPAFSGVDRFEVKRTTYVSIDGIEYPSVVTLTSSIPVQATLGVRTDIHTNAALLARDPLVKAAFETGVMPT
jgi:hypothetical protein